MYIEFQKKRKISTCKYRSLYGFSLVELSALLHTSTTIIYKFHYCNLLQKILDEKLAERNKRILDIPSPQGKIETMDSQRIAQ